MSDPLSHPCTAFEGHRRVARGALVDVALAVRAAMAADPHASILVFGDTTGAVIDLDLRGTTADMLARLARQVDATQSSKAEAEENASDEERVSPGGRGRGRPRLGVVAREVTLLPRHWEWLAQQRGGASQALRRLVDEARRADGGRTRTRANQERAYRFMSAMAGNLPGFEDASRALFAGEPGRFAEHTASWPPDVRDHAHDLARTAAAPSTGNHNDG
jgi:hypothetical protein